MRPLVTISSLLIAALLWSRPATGQTLTSLDTLLSLELADSLRPFTLENFYELILENHPVARQTALLSDVAKQEVRLARGNFDPKIEAQYFRKRYNDKNYYETVYGAVKFPTVFPINPVIGMEQNSGDYLDPQLYINDEFGYRQFYAGFSIPLGRGLLTDERRAALRQAQLFVTMTEAEQVKLINKLLLEATKEYWQWFFSYNNYKLQVRSVAIAEEIFRRVKVNFQFGEAAMIDTVQARITWQQRLIDRQEAWLAFQNAGISISNYLWLADGQPAQLDQQWAPVGDDSPSLELQTVEELVDFAKENHPEIRKLDVKLRQIEVDRKLAAEFLKPQLNLSYYLLNQPINPAWEFSLNPSGNNKIGVDFAFPILLRKERSKLALTKIKFSSTTYERNLAERQIVNDLQGTYNRLVNIQAVLKLQRTMASDYQKLLAAELLNLEQGESDLFKINLQMEKVIQAQTKVLKLSADLEKERAYLYWAAGLRNLRNG